jgi:hypothetical protein
VHTDLPPCCHGTIYLSHYRCREIDNLALIRSQYNVADALTRIDGNDALLRMLRCGMIDHPIEDFVIA